MKPEKTIPLARAESVSEKLRQFYRDNPAEMLTLDDIAVKFDCTRRTAQWAVGYLRKSKSVRTMIVVVKETA